MIPEQRLSDLAYTGQLLNPWTNRTDLSQHWGPVALQDPSQGLLVRLWQARAVGANILLSAPGVDEFVHLTHSEDVLEVSLAFNQNGDAHLAFVDSSGDAWLRWYDSTIPGMTTTQLDADTVNPRVTLDDARQFNVSASDVILGYVRDGILRYRRQRDRFADEFTPPHGEGGPSASAGGLHHMSMNSQLRVEFITDDAAPS